MNDLSQNIEIYAVSACLIGCDCKYNGGNNYHDAVVAFLKEKQYISVCPEQLGGLSTPREPSEIISDGDSIKVVTESGLDVTEQFMRGAEKALDILLENGITLAILKSRSPSCGCGQIYDGTFSGQLIEGNGITAELMQKNHITIMNEEDFQ